MAIPKDLGRDTPSSITILQTEWNPILMSHWHGAFLGRRYEHAESLALWQR